MFWVGGFQNGHHGGWYTLKRAGKPEMEIPSNLAVESAGHLKVLNYWSGGTTAMRALLLLLLTELLSTAQSAPPSGLTKLLDAELSSFRPEPVYM